MAFRSKERRREYERNRYHKKRKYETRAILLKSARHRAKQKGVPFDLELEDIVVPEFCPLLNIRLEVGNGRPIPASPTLDRIKPELGYVKGNVIVISHRANCIKSDATLDEIELLCINLRSLM